MAEDLEIIISAIDQASQVFQDIISSALNLGDEVSNSVGSASTDFDDMGSSAEDAASSVDDVGNAMGGLDGSNTSDAAGGMGELGDAADDADRAVEDLGNDLGIINAGMLLQTAEQIGSIGSNAENMAQDMNEASITVGQLATQTGIAEPKMVDLINTISNATFPQAEAMAYVGALNQMGVSADKLGASATNMDKINDATGIGYEKTMQLTQGLQSVGVSADNLPSTFNAIAYAQSNVNGGADTLTTVLKRQASTINEYGLNTDQLVLIMQKLSEKGVQGMKMGSELSKVLKEADGNTQQLEQSLGLQAGTLENASNITGKYNGKLQQLADEEAEHKTILDQLGAAWEDISLKASGVLSPLGSAIGLVGEVGSFGMQVRGLKELGTTFTSVKSAISGFNAVQTVTNGLQKASATVTAVVTSAKTALGVAQATVTAEEIGAAAAHASGAASIGLEGVAATEAAGAFGILGAAELTALWPIGLIVAAVVGLGAAFYGLGKYFGWWTDFGTMIDSIKAGITRLWNAFINHPDIQAIISVIQTAWSNVSKVIGDVMKRVLEFFGISQGAEFDAIEAIITTVGKAWDIWVAPIKAVINAIRTLDGAVQTVKANWPTLATVLGVIFAPIATVYNALRSIVCILLGCSPGIVPALEKVKETFMSVLTFVAGIVGEAVNNILSTFQPLIDILNMVVSFVATEFMNSWTAMSNIIIAIVTHINNVILAFTQFLNGQLSLNGLLSTIWASINNTFSIVLANIVTLVSGWRLKLIKLAIDAAKKFVTNIINNIKNLPNRVRTIVTQVYTRIKTGATQWVTMARTKAHELLTKSVNALKNLPSQIGGKISSTASTISRTAKQWVTAAKEKAGDMVDKAVDKAEELPDKIGTEFGKIGPKIRSKVSSAVKAATSFGSNIKNAVLKALHIASPGIIQRKVVGEFEDTITRIRGTAKSAYDAAKNVASNLKQGFGAVNLDENLNAEYINGINNTNEVHTIDEQTLEIKVKHEHDYNFKGLPDTISAKEVADMINEANQNDSWIKKLTNNPRFQQFDLKEKQKITRHNKRVTGV